MIGYIADEPTMHNFSSGSKVAHATLVTNEYGRNQETGQREEVPEWHRVSFWGNLADTVETYVHKGSRLYCEGRLKTRNYTDKEGISRYITEIMVTNMIMLDNRRDGGDDYSGARRNNGYNKPDYNAQNSEQIGRSSSFDPAGQWGNDKGASNPPPVGFNNQQKPNLPAPNSFPPAAPTDGFGGGFNNQGGRAPNYGGYNDRRGGNAPAPWSSPNQNQAPSMGMGQGPASGQNMAPPPSPMGGQGAAPSNRDGGYQPMNANKPFSQPQSNEAPRPRAPGMDDDIPF